MTVEEFTRNSIALLGSAVSWEDAIATRLKIPVRELRIRLAEGQVPSWAASKLMDAIGEPVPAGIHARWILGDGSDGREYLIHTMFPRFRCLVVAAGDDWDLEADDSGVFQANPETWLANFHWQDRRPDDLAALMDAAADAVENF